MRPLRHGLAPAVVAVVVLAAPRPDASGDHPVTIEPSRVEMTMLFTGARVHVVAPVAADARVAVVLVGEDRTIALKRKGKVLGLIWMNVGDVSFDAVPDVYLLRTTCTLEALADPTVRARLGLGLDVLRTRSATTAEDRALFDDLVRLKWQDGLWNVAESSVTLHPADVGGDTPAGSARAETEFVLPARTPPGEYRVRVYAFIDGRAEIAAEGELQVVQAGVAAFITDLATRHGLLYGVLAVVVAGAAGLLTGVVFGLGSKKGH